MFGSLYQLTLLVSTMSVLAFPVLAQAPDKAVMKSAFDTDPRLDWHIALERTGVPLDRLFTTLNADQQRQIIFQKPSLHGQPPEKPVWLLLNDMPSPGVVAGMAGADLVRRVRLEVVTSPPTIVPK